MRDLAFSIIICWVTFVVAKLSVGHGDWLYPTPYCPQSQTTLGKHRRDSTFPVPKRRNGLFGFKQQHLATQAVRQGDLPFPTLPVTSQPRLQSATTADAFWWDPNSVLLVFNWFPALEENEFCYFCTRWSWHLGARIFNCWFVL